MAFQRFGRGTSGIMSRISALCNFARRYPYAELLNIRTGSTDMGDAVALLVAACDAFQIGDNNPWESDAVAPSTSPEDVEE